MGWLIMREITEAMARSAGETLRLVLGRVVHLDSSSLLVSLSDGEDIVEVDSRVVQPAAELALLEPGDEVLVGVVGDRCLLFGRVSSSRLNDDRVPDTMIIEAKTGLTLRVGEGSITVREDGRILIKGKDLVSHAKRVNRIRGGSVAIN
jgi:hypothetical protein